MKGQLKLDEKNAGEKRMQTRTFILLAVFWNVDKMKKKITCNKEGVM